MNFVIYKYTCAIARSTNLIGDKWSLLILRDVILHKKTRFKEFKNSKEKISTNILSNRLKSLMEYGLLEKLNPLGTKKSTRYLATSKGVLALPIIIELYIYSIESIDESVLDESQIDIKIKAHHLVFYLKKKERHLMHFQKINKAYSGTRYLCVIVSLLLFF